MCRLCLSVCRPSHCWLVSPSSFCHSLSLPSISLLFTLLSNPGTNHVQYANITFINTTVSLVCVFADTSSAVGCRFQLELSNTTEIVHLERTMNGCVVTQHCTTTQNMRSVLSPVQYTEYVLHLPSLSSPSHREAYLSLTVVAILSNGSVGEFITHPEVFVTDDPADISPCELPASGNHHN